MKKTTKKMETKEQKIVSIYKFHSSKNSDNRNNTFVMLSRSMNKIKSLSLVNFNMLIEELTSLVSEYLIVNSNDENIDSVAVPYAKLYKQALENIGLSNGKESPFNFFEYTRDKKSISLDELIELESKLILTREQRFQLQLGIAKINNARL